MFIDTFFDVFNFIVLCAIFGYIYKTSLVPVLSALIAEEKKIRERLTYAYNKMLNRKNTVVKEKIDYEIWRQKMEKNRALWVAHQKNELHIMAEERAQRMQENALRDKKRDLHRAFIKAEKDLFPRVLAAVKQSCQTVYKNKAEQERFITQSLYRLTKRE